MKKIWKKTGLPILISVLLFFYFFGISILGDKNRETTKKGGASSGLDTVLTSQWKFRVGNNIEWASPLFDDSNWLQVRSDSLPKEYQGEEAWFRLRFQLPEKFSQTPLCLTMYHYGASEIYLNGNKIASFGKVSDKAEEEITMNPRSILLDVQIESNREHLIAVHYSNNQYPSQKRLKSDMVGFVLNLQDAQTGYDYFFGVKMVLHILNSIAVFIMTLSFVHFLLFLFYKKAKENLYYSLFAFSYSLLFFVSGILTGIISRPQWELTATIFMQGLIPVIILTLHLFVEKVYNSRLPKWYWGFMIGLALIIIVNLFTEIIPSWIFGSMISWMIISTVLVIVIVTYRAIKNQKPGAKILGIGLGIFALFLFAIISFVFYTKHLSFSGIWIAILIIVALLSIPISMSIYLAYHFSLINRNLSYKLLEVEKLSAQTLAQEKEKQEILSKQKEILEIQVAERTKEVVEQKKIIEEKNKDITDSIMYAKRIQDAILPSEEQIKKMLPDSFVFFKPKDIVSGDFYFFAEAETKVIVAAVDCTGHGVPGAFMSMVGANHLKRIVREQGITDTSRILDELHKQVLLSLNRDITKRDSKDGMDVAIISIDKSKKEVQFSGAVRPLYYFVNGIFNEVKGERYSIAGVKEIGSDPYASTTIAVTEPTTFYLFSDGFADQFGEKEGKKLMSKNFRKLLASIQNKTMEGQKHFLEKFFDEWKGCQEQMDDVTIIGIRIIPTLNEFTN